MMLQFLYGKLIFKMCGDLKQGNETVACCNLDVLQKGGKEEKSPNVLPKKPSPPNTKGKSKYSIDLYPLKKEKKDNVILVANAQKRSKLQAKKGWFHRTKKEMTKLNQIPPYFINLPYPSTHNKK